MIENVFASYEVDAVPRDLLVAHYLTTAYAYYVLGESLIADAQFDALAKRLDREWERVVHWHKQLIDRQALREGGSAYYIQFPLRVQNAAKQALRESGRWDPLDVPKRSRQFRNALVRLAAAPAEIRPQAERSVPVLVGEVPWLMVLTAAAMAAAQRAGLTAALAQALVDAAGSAGELLELEAEWSLVDKTSLWER